MNEVKILNIGGVDQNIKDQYVRDIIASSENGLDSSTNLPVSSRHYDEGDYLIAQDRKYYEAITDIEIGDPLVVGTNIRATTVTEEILMLKGQSANVAIETIADMETAATASKAFATGKYVYWNYGVYYGMYEVIADIAQGDAFATSGNNQNIKPANKIGDDVSLLKRTTTNTNLLDNPWFTVNQRDITSWAEYNSYIADRWMVDGGDGSIVAGVVSHTGVLIQRMEDGIVTTLLGKVLTASILKSDNTIESVTFTMPNAITSTYTTVAQSDSFSVLLRSNNQSQIMRINAGVSVKAAKLELGPRSTLANDVAPNYAEELIKCKRYFVRVRDHIVQLHDNGAGELPYFNDFRAIPRILNVSSSLYKSGVWQDISSDTYITASNSSIIRESISHYDAIYHTVRISYDASADL